MKKIAMICGEAEWIEWAKERLKKAVTYNRNELVTKRKTYVRISHWTKLKGHSFDKIVIMPSFRAVQDVRQIFSEMAQHMRAS